MSDLMLCYTFLFGPVPGYSFFARLGRASTKLVSLAVYAAMVYGMIRLFNLRINSKKYSIESEIGEW